jgi:hypothetical protein
MEKENARHIALDAGNGKKGILQDVSLFQIPVHVPHVVSRTVRLLIDSSN